MTTETLAVMGATLANGGICPTTGEKVLHTILTKTLATFGSVCNPPLFNS